MKTFHPGMKLALEYPNEKYCYTFISPTVAKHSFADEIVIKPPNEISPTVAKHSFGE